MLQLAEAAILLYESSATPKTGICLIGHALTEPAVEPSRSTSCTKGPSSAWSYRIRAKASIGSFFPMCSSPSGRRTARRRVRTTHQDVITCPVCHALIVGASACPDPRVHEHREKHVPPPAQPILYGGQQPPYRSWHRMDDRGRAMITFRAHDGTEKEYPVLWGWIDPVTGNVTST
jgi:hypothetical protein